MTFQEQSTHALDQASKIARVHGQQRSGLGWDIVALVRDYEILHGVALEHLGHVLSERLTYRQAMILGTMVDRATGSAVEAFSQMAQQRLEDQVKRQQAELRQLTLDLTEAEHHERQRIAARLHDDLQQMLVAMRMQLSAALTGDAPDRSAVEEVIGLTDQAVETSRNLAADLYPRVLEHQSLPEALVWLGDVFQQWYSLTVTVDLQVAWDSDPGPLPLRRLVYDAVRELLFNVVKHAQTDQAWVRICCGEQSPWRLEVEDRGVGSAEMAKAAAPSGRSFGLGNVRQRIEQIGGTVEADSKPGEGTRVILTVPLQGE
ncbi:MAG: ATP-binding protein [Phycisphaeraceae bacterium]